MTIMKNFWISLKYTLAMCVLLTLGYVLVLRLVARVASPNDGEAELVYADGKAVGAANVGQIFTDSIYFWGRPSAVDYDGGGAGGSNKGTTNPEYLAEVEGRIAAFLEAHPYLSREEVPSEMVTASGSGLDPDISVRGAEVQARRVAQARGMDEQEVLRIIGEQTEGPWLGLFGTSKVNVLKLNVALDAAQKAGRN
jgi:K+-transporting ATPase ATPase C chain